MNGRQDVERTNRDSLRWLSGIVLAFMGLLIFASLVFSFFCWKSDASLLNMDSDVRDNVPMEWSNGCGSFGAWIGDVLVNQSFGLFGLVVPIIMMVCGLNIIRQRKISFNKTILSLVLVMIFGSLTLGFALGDNFSVICQSGWGGALGIDMSNLLHGFIGSVGLFILLVTCWILIGVFINRNFINTVNSAGNAFVDKSEKVVEIVKNKVVSHTSEEDTKGPVSEVRRTPLRVETAPREERIVREEPRREEPVREESRQNIHREEERPAVQERVAAQPVRTAPVMEEPVAPAEEEREADFQIERGGEEIHPSEVETDTRMVEIPGEEELSEQPEMAENDEADDFIELEMSQENDRVVMGRGGLVELAPIRRREPDTAMSLRERQRGVTLREEDTDEGLEEIRVSGNAEEQPLHDRYNTTTEEESQYPDEVEEDDDFGIEVIDNEPESAGEEHPRHDATHEMSDAHEGEMTPDEERGVVVTVENHNDPLMSAGDITTDAYDPLKDLVNYHKPPVELLEDYVSDSDVTDDEIYENKRQIETTLKNFGIPIQNIKATVGPTVTLYEIVQNQGVKISKIQGLENDIAQSLKASGIRIIGPIPGAGTIGIEVPNRNKKIVSMYSAICSKKFQESKAELPVVIGRTIQNENYVFDLAKMPHLLVAGATGQGKSVGLNAIITSLLYRKHPSQLKFVLIDPKMVEFSLYSKIERHFLAKMESEEEAVVTDPQKAVYTLNSLCVEMGERLELCKKAGARNIVEYNEKFVARRLNPNKGHRYLPYIVVVVDEFADLIMTAREVEAPVMRLAQKARAVGIHLIIATQRPDVKVITGGIKANFPARIAFRVMQMIDSRTIIDQPGANQLIGRGDMLFAKDGCLTRIQCALVETKEVERIVDYISKQQGYTSAYALTDYAPDSGEGGSGLGSEESSAPVKYDSLFGEIARDAVTNGQISTSMIQRNYEVGFNRAGRIMMQLERSGIVGAQHGAKPRDILFHDLPSLEAKLQSLGVF